jgi:hypothetical protein
MSLGEIASLGEAREVVAASVAPTTYEPHESLAWRDARARFAAAVELPRLEVHA